MPLALTVASGGGVHVHALNRAAEDMGLARGMALADARAIVPDLASHPADPDADLCRLRGLARWCERYTPWVNVDGADGLVLDISGCAHLFGGERALLADLSARLGALGLAHRLALAATRGAAWALARHGADKAGISDAETPPDILEAIGGLPVEALRLGAEAVQTLRRLGLTNIGQVAAIPRIALKRRFAGSDLAGAVVRRLDQALGDMGEPVSPLMPAPCFRARRAFAEPVLEIAGIERALEELLFDLCAVLEQKGVGARRLRLAAYRTDGDVTAVSVGTSEASRDVLHLMFLFREKMQVLEGEYGVDLVILGIDEVAPLAGQQLSLTDTRRQDVPVSQLVDRLSGRLGARQVRCRRLRESHIPERAERQVPALAVQGRQGRQGRGKSQELTLSARASWRDSRLAMPFLPPVRPFRLFAHPEILEVVAEVPDGPPVSFRWRRMRVRVTRAEGPERIAPEWWNAYTNEARGGGSAVAMVDYYRLEDAMGRRFWVYRSGLYDSALYRDPAPPAENAPQNAPQDSPRWFMHGLFV